MITNSMAERRKEAVEKGFSVSTVIADSFGEGNELSLPPPPPMQARPDLQRAMSRAPPPLKRMSRSNSTGNVECLSSDSEDESVDMNHSDSIYMYASKSKSSNLDSVVGNLLVNKQAKYMNPDFSIATTSSIFDATLTDGDPALVTPPPLHKFVPPVSSPKSQVSSEPSKQRRKQTAPRLANNNSSESISKDGHTIQGPDVDTVFIDWRVATSVEVPIIEMKSNLNDDEFRPMLVRSKDRPIMKKINANQDAVVRAKQFLITNSQLSVSPTSSPTHTDHVVSLPREMPALIKNPQPCSRFCKGVVNAVPYAQCRVCLSLFHSECIDWATGGQCSVSGCIMNSRLGASKKENNIRVPLMSKSTTPLINQALSCNVAPAAPKESKVRRVTLCYDALEKIDISTPFVLDLDKETFRVDPSHLISTKTGIDIFIKDDRVLQPSEVPVKHHPSAPSVQKLPPTSKITASFINQTLSRTAAPVVPKESTGCPITIPYRVLEKIGLSTPFALGINNKTFRVDPSCLIYTKTGVKIFIKNDQVLQASEVPVKHHSSAPSVQKKYSSTLDCCNRVSSPKPDKSISESRSSDPDNLHLDESQAVKEEVIAPISDGAGPCIISAPISDDAGPCTISVQSLADPNAVKETFYAATMDAGTETNEITSDGSLSQQKEMKLPPTSKITASLINQTLSRTAAPAVLKGCKGPHVTIPYHVLGEIDPSAPFALGMNNETFIVDPSCLIYTKTGVKIFIKNGQVVQLSELPLKHHPSAPSVQKKYSSTFDCCNRVSSPKPDEIIPEPRSSDLDNSHLDRNLACKTEVICPNSDDAWPCIIGVQSLADSNAVKETSDAATMDSGRETNKITSDGSLHQQKKTDANRVAGEDLTQIIADLMDSMLQAITCYIDDEQSYGLALKKEKSEGLSLAQVTTNQLHEDSLTTNQLHDDFLTTKCNTPNEPVDPQPTHAHQVDSLSEILYEQKETVSSNDIKTYRKQSSQEREERLRKDRERKATARALETEQQRNERLAKNRESAARRRASLSDQELQLRRAKDRERITATRSQETDEQREQRLARDRERITATRSQETDEQREQRRARNRERIAAKRSQETEEQREQRRACDRERMAAKRSLETEEQREERLARDRERIAAKRSLETDEQREQRLACDRERMAAKRSPETEEQREQILACDRERITATRSLETDEQREERLSHDRERITAKRSLETYGQREQILARVRERITAKRSRETEQQREQILARD
ncbi:uncharacterized protein [Watersipora subatra]|uniref:uncharacterized protein n=1 Tax=Watersipora subatra TaxID=2589382 RepID=UPI00355BE495